MDFFSNIFCHGTLVSNKLRIKHAADNIVPQLPTSEEAYIDEPFPGSWGQIETQHIVYTSEPQNVDAPSEYYQYNLLHLNGLGTDNTTSSIITQIAGVANGRLYYRNGNQNGWYASGKQFASAWRELIDDNGGQTINGELFVEKVQIHNSQGGYNPLHNLMITSTAFHILRDGDGLTLDGIGQGGSYGIFESKLALGKQAPVNEAGTCILQRLVSQSAIGERATDDGAGIMQTYYALSSPAFWQRRMAYHYPANGTRDWSDWYVFCPTPKNCVINRNSTVGSSSTYTVDGSQYTILIGDCIHVKLYRSASGTGNSYLKFANMPGTYSGYLFSTYGYPSFKCAINASINTDDNTKICFSEGGAHHIEVLYWRVS